MLPSLLDWALERSRRVDNGLQTFSFPQLSEMSAFCVAGCCWHESRVNEGQDLRRMSKTIIADFSGDFIKMIDIYLRGDIMNVSRRSSWTMQCSKCIL
ncbi:hypothetical protein CapIbe_009157 [Capra ibex]